MNFRLIFQRNPIPGRGFQRAASIGEKKIRSDPAHDLVLSNMAPFVVDNSRYVKLGVLARTDPEEFFAWGVVFISSERRDVSGVFELASGIAVAVLRRRARL